MIDQHLVPAGYAFSKLAGERLCQSYLHEYGLAYTTVRPFNVYGPGDLPGRNIGDGHVIPELSARILRGENQVKLLGSGDQTRKLLYVDDCISAILAMLSNPHASNTDFNIGSSEEITMTDLAARIWRNAKLTGSPTFHHIPAFAGDVPRRGADATRAQKLLGWTPTVSLDEGLQHYLRWCETVQ